MSGPQNLRTTPPAPTPGPLSGPLPVTTSEQGGPTSGPPRTTLAGQVRTRPPHVVGARAAPRVLWIKPVCGNGARPPATSKAPCGVPAVGVT